MKNRKLLTSVAAGSLALTSIIGLGAGAFAADSSSSTTKSKAPTAAQIAEHESQRKADMEEQLSQAVTDGKITAAQKTAILEFLEENKPGFDSDATHEERHAQMDAFKEKVEAFAEDNNIDLDVLKPSGGPGGHGGKGGTPPSQAERAAHIEEELSSKVEAGTISEAQKAAILKFFADNEPLNPSDSATQAERKAAMDSFKEKVDAFAQANDIDVDVLKPSGGPGGHGGPGGENSEK